jgi:hypothetical protein
VGRPATEVPVGSVWGCWTVLRPATPDAGKRRFLVRASCCGDEVIRRFDNLIVATGTACNHCCRTRSHSKGGPAAAARKRAAHA